MRHRRRRFASSQRNVSMFLWTGATHDCDHLVLKSSQIKKKGAVIIQREINTLEWCPRDVDVLAAICRYRWSSCAVILQIGKPDKWELLEINRKKGGLVSQETPGLLFTCTHEYWNLFPEWPKRAGSNHTRVISKHNLSITLCTMERHWYLPGVSCQFMELMTAISLLFLHSRPALIFLYWLFFILFMEFHIVNTLI